ncbi:hypothetical protein KC992_04295 [Candidatus Saccharibacteria bacterium]|nr:hypothetical protein [Candidatus Saccharibacteria bacterium]
MYKRSIVKRPSVIESETLPPDNKERFVDLHEVASHGARLLIEPTIEPNDVVLAELSKIFKEIPEGEVYRQDELNPSEAYRGYLDPVIMPPEIIFDGSDPSNVTSIEDDLSGPELIFYSQIK